MLKFHRVLTIFYPAFTGINIYLTTPPFNLLTYAILWYIFKWVISVKKLQLKNMVLSAMLLAIGLVLPFLTGQIKEIGNMLLPMHVPVLLCGLICGWRYGLIIGFIMPLMRYSLFGMPQLYPNAIAMAFELAAYGFVIGFLYSHSRWQCIKALYRCLIIAMIAGRAVLAVANMVLFGLSGDVYTLPMFMAGAFTNALPGIILQLIAIPIIMVALDRAKIVTFLDAKEMSEKYAK